MSYLRISGFWLEILLTVYVEAERKSQLYMAEFKYSLEMGWLSTLHMFAGIYRDFAGKSECGDFKFTGIACIPAIPVIFEVNQKKSVDFLYIHFIKIFQISL